MNNEPFYISNRMTITLEGMLSQVDSLEEFEKRFAAEFRANDDHVGNIVNEKKRNPSRDAGPVCPRRAAWCCDVFARKRE